VGITAAGITTPGVKNLQYRLDAQGYDNVVFHVTSAVMEQIVSEGYIDGILDFTPYELIQIFLTGDVKGRDTRLESAGEKGIPQIFVPGGLDSIVLRKPKSEISEKYKGRKMSIHGPFVTIIRTQSEELDQLAEIIADKLNRWKGPAAVLAPLQGFSELDKRGRPFFDHQTDLAFLARLKAGLKPEIRYEEVDHHINDEKFADKVVDIYDTMSKRGD
jgi:uncharacterized protein (UPF0261 family)